MLKAQMSDYNISEVALFGGTITIQKDLICAVEGSLRLYCPFENPIQFGLPNANEIGIL